MSVARCAQLFLSKNSLLLNQRITHIHRDLGTIRLLSTISKTQPSMPRDVHTVSEHRTSTVETLEPKMGFIARILKKTGILDVQKYRNMDMGYEIYEHVIGQVDYPFFFKHFNMPDTFVAWFLVTELHVWMIMTRYMADEKNGKAIRNYAVAAMWQDTQARIENLGPIKTKLKNKQIQEISHQFNAAIIGYDEGIQSDDKVLAGALWRRFFQLECNNPEHIETLLIYVRKQICLFDSLPNEEILRKPILKLIDIKN
ncbi:PREDICTED: ubiquinol-cytochrome-c reductase complex assembly factor 1 [Trachymyrmex septentrionalis]|uniref:ubiquinol-cytochrome-c reductase complex assembly factor 1 n=1 Tax=Trachymyrmex septentrionalis TaxID=34720 RepID=UPI00084EE723|nr:PREDICTED: ubiquinol-cytochrome-c reductase complex assembly factor 1 [Trachymyrmex septentrionalis]